jgi:hypothetical protein
VFARKRLTNKRTIKAEYPVQKVCPVDTQDEIHPGGLRFIKKHKSQIAKNPRLKQYLEQRARDQLEGTLEVD